VRALIVHSDDFGLSSPVNRGIARAHREGVLTSASILPNGPVFAEAAELARATPGLGVGIEWNLVRGRPLCAPERIRSLVGSSGCFPGDAGRVLARGLLGRLDPEHVARELEAQLARVRDAGLLPTHVCGEKHGHLFPGVAEVAARVAGRGGVRAFRSIVAFSPAKSEPVSEGGGLAGRARAEIVLACARTARRYYAAAGLVGTDGFIGLARTGTVDVRLVEEAARGIGEGVHELMTHVGESGSIAPAEWGRYRIDASRPRELAALCAPGLRERIAGAGVLLVHFGHLGGTGPVVAPRERA